MNLPATWPRMLYELNPGSGNANLGLGNEFNWADLTKRMTGKSGISRGVQFELDAIQPGTWQGTWINTDGLLDPSNSASPFELTPFVPWIIRAQYPPTVNRLTPDQATAGEGTPLAPGPLPTGPASTGIGWYGFTGDLTAAGITIAADATAWEGSQVFSATLTTQASTETSPFVLGVPVAAGEPYSYSIYLRCTTPAATLSVQAQLWWTNVSYTVAQSSGATAALVGTALGGWTRLTVSGVAPAGTLSCLAAVTLMVPVTVQATIEADGLQFETGLAPSPWSRPSPWYYMYAGQLERYPQSWTNSGSYGTVAPQAVDVFALLSQIKFTDLMSATLMAAAADVRPDFVYPFDDPEGSTSFADFTGNRAPAAWDGNATFAAGVAQTSTNPSGSYASAPNQTVIALTPSSLPANNAEIQAPAIIIPPNDQGVYGPSNNGSGWTRQIAFRCTQLPPTGSLSVIWLVDGFASNNNFIYLMIGPTGAVQCVLNDIYSTTTLNLGTVDAGDWHLAAVTMAGAGNLATGCLDGVITTQAVGGSGTWSGSGNAFDDDTLGALAYTGSNTQAGVFEGNLSWYAQWPTPLPQPTLVSLYNTWRFAGAGESSGARYLRILNLAGYQGLYAVDSGSSTSLGPATDVANNDALTCLNDVVETENGAHFVSGRGTVTFYARSRLFQINSPSFVFGEDTAAGEWPYDDVATDFDPTHLGNVLQITQVSTNQVTTAQDLASLTQYGMRTLTRNNQSTSQEEINDCATFLLSRYRQTRQRVESLVLNPGAVPALWPVALALELWTRIRVVRRPPGAPPIQLDGFVTNLVWATDDQNGATLTIEAAPADPMPYAAFTTLRSATTGALAVGAMSVGLTALADNALNPAAANIAVGQQLVLDPGTASAELVTVASVSATSAGYTTFTVTLQAGCAFVHSAGAVVAEPFPGWATTTLAAYEPVATFGTAVFDSTTAVFDPTNVFDACAFSY